jgi:uncharacterized iron-regulated membrane protein
MLFQLHLWCGLALCGWALLMGLSGSALVFKQEIDQALHPELFALPAMDRERAGATGSGSLDAVHAEVQRRFPDHFAGGFWKLDESEASSYLWIAKEDANGDLVDRYNVHFDQRTGELLGAEQRYTGVTGTLENLHFFLLLGRKGLVLNSVLGMGLFTLCVTGVVLWWPGTGRIRSALGIAWRAGWRRINYDLHRTAGFAVAALLLVSSFTGAYFGLAAPARVWFAQATGGTEQDARAYFVPPVDAQLRAGASRLTVDEVRRRSKAALPASVSIFAITLPRKPGGAFTVDARSAGSELLAERVRLFVHPATGAVIRRFDATNTPPGVRLANAMAPLHFGNWGGLPVKILWCLLGLAPGTLAATGFLMWWNRVLRRRWRAWQTLRIVAVPERALASPQDSQGPP